MSHFWTSDDHPAARRAQIEDWLESLEEFSLDHIEAACREWRNTQTKRPTVAEIRTLAAAEEQRSLQKRQYTALPPPRLTYAQIVERIDRRFDGAQWETCWWGDVRIVRHLHIDDHSYPGEVQPNV